jgi:hypothetical protein
LLRCAVFTGRLCSTIVLGTIRVVNHAKVSGMCN